jgi:hypothetical protein
MPQGNPIADFAIFRRRLTHAYHECDRFLGLGATVPISRARDFMASVERDIRSAAAIRQTLPTGQKLNDVVDLSMITPPANLNTAWNTVASDGQAMKAEYETAVQPLMVNPGSWDDTNAEHTEGTLIVPATFTTLVTALRTSLDAWA